LRKPSVRLLLVMMVEIDRQLWLSVPVKHALDLPAGHVA
jgi:hypothetical protein